MKIVMQAAALLASTALASGAFAAGKPLAKDCGPNNDYTIGFSQANFKEPYREHVNHELERLVKNYPKFKLVIADGQANVNTQVSQVENFTTQQVDLLMISPFEAAPLTPVVSRVYKSGVPVIELDRKTTGDEYTAFVGGDNHQIAKEAGEWAAKTLMPEGGEAAILEGLPSSSPAIERLEGFKEGVAANPKLKVVAVQPVDWMEDKAVTVFSAMLQAHPDIKLVYTSNDLAASGAYIAAKQAGKTDIKIIGTDGLPGPSGGMRSVADGQWAATYTYPTGAAQALELAKKILIECATEVPRNVVVPSQRIDQSNAKELFGKEQF
jgi:ribose transport system substrate-binding protein